MAETRRQVRRHVVGGQADWESAMRNRRGAGRGTV